MFVILTNRQYKQINLNTHEKNIVYIIFLVFYNWNFNNIYLWGTLYYLNFQTFVTQKPKLWMLQSFCLYFFRFFRWNWIVYLPTRNCMRPHSVPKKLKLFFQKLYTYPKSRIFFYFFKSWGQKQQVHLSLHSNFEI